MHILIYEPEFGGHRLSGVRVLMESLLELDSKLISSITLASTLQAPESEEFQEQLVHLKDNFHFREVDDFGLGTRSFLQIAFRKSLSFLKLAKSEEWDQVYVPYGDGMIQVLSFLCFLPGFRLPNSVVSETILMRCTSGYKNVSKFKQFLNSLVIRCSPFSKIHFIDPIPYQYIKRVHRSHLSRVALLPVPISETPILEQGTSRRSLGLALDARIAGCVGRIDARKGADLLINAFVEADLEDTDLLLLAGKHSEQLVSLINSLGDKRIISFNHYLSEDDMMKVFSSLNLVVTPYKPSFVGSASISIRAASANKPCLGTNAGWMAYVIPLFGLGDVCDVINKKEFAFAISSALKQANEFKLPPKGEAFVAYQKLSNIKAHLTSLIRQNAGLEQDANKVEWPDNNSS